MLLVEYHNDHDSRFLLARIRLSPFALIGFAALIHMPLRIFGVPISLDLYALHDARRINSRLTRSIGLKFECPHTHIHASPFNFLSVIFRTTRLPSRLTIDKAILSLLVSTAKTIAYRSRLASNYPPPLSRQWFSWFLRKAKASRNELHKPIIFHRIKKGLRFNSSTIGHSTRSSSFTSLAAHLSSPSIPCSQQVYEYYVGSFDISLNNS
jgi:hypothetical protein